MTTSAHLADLPAEGTPITIALPDGGLIRMRTPSHAVFGALRRARDAVRAGRSPDAADVTAVMEWADQDDDGMTA